MKKIFICFCLIFLVFACSKKENGTTLVTIDNDKITLEEFNKELDKIPTNMKMLVATQTGKKNYLDRLVVKKLLLREAKKQKIDSDKEFQDRLGDIKEQLLIESVLKKRLNADTSIKDADLKKNIQDLSNKGLWQEANKLIDYSVAQPGTVTYLVYGVSIVIVGFVMFVIGYRVKKFPKQDYEQDIDREV